MQIEIEDIVDQKTRDLCQAILDQPNLRSARERISAFIADDDARGQYEAVMAKGQELQKKQQAQHPLSAEEISSFESLRENLINNNVARGFLEAQEELHHVQESIHSLVSKTIELGRVPSAEELSEGESCGTGCGCH
jgi:cell fate (sporulation/competence/biofilm development) regulator YlbF (YheA/YmcA/DUF963 family)